MSSPTSETLAKTFIGILKSIGISEKEPITDEKPELYHHIYLCHFDTFLIVNVYPTPIKSTTPAKPGGYLW
jgi:hypothetical protein